MSLNLFLLFVTVVAIVYVSRNRRHPASPIGVLFVTAPAEVHVKAVERKPVAAVVTAAPDASRAVAIICGKDPATSNRYEARNDALRAIVRRRDLPKKNDVMNLLRSQEPPPKGLAETLMGMFEGNSSTHNSPTHPHPPAVFDYCIQHLGAMQGEITDDSLRRRIRETFVLAARQTRQPYAGTALYSIAQDKRASLSQKNELKRLTIALCKQGSHPVARVSAIQLAGERGYKEILPILRKTLSSARRDAVLDIVSIGSLGLLGEESDLELLSKFSSDTRRAVAVKAAIKRIKERAGVKR